MPLYDKLIGSKDSGEPSVQIRRSKPTPNLLRDMTGIFVCAIIVFASILMGFVQVAVKVFFNQDVNFDASWSANLSAMASMALGALIQQKVGSGAGGIGINPGAGSSVILPPVPYVPPAPDAASGVCSCCGQPLPATDSSGVTIKPAPNDNNGG